MRHEQRRNAASRREGPDVAARDERNFFAIGRERWLGEVRARLSKDVNHAACHQNDYKQQLQHVGRLRKKIRTQSALIRDPKRTHRKRTKLSHLYRHSKELETTIRKLFKTAKMLDNRNIMAQQNCVRRTITIARSVDVERIDPNQGCG